MGSGSWGFGLEKQSVLLCVSLFFLLVGFQNCGEVDFAKSQNDLSAKSGGLDDGNLDDLVELNDPNDGDPNMPELPRDPSSEEPLDNPQDAGMACLEKFQSMAGADLQGADFKFNGVQEVLDVRNAGSAKINGVTSQLFIDGANRVNVNGAHGDVCIRAKNIESVNGVSGRGTSPIVLIGQDSNSSVGSLNGSRSSDLVLINLVSTGSINGTNRNIYVRGGKIARINGVGGSLYVMDGATIERISGNFKKVYVQSGSSIVEAIGNIDIEPL